MASIRELTVKERILLHLFDYARHAGDYEVPVEVTQSGIAKAARIRVQHATQYVRPLVSEELVEEDTRHVLRQARRRKAYFLTPSGRHRVASMRSALLKEEVPFGQGGGQVTQVQLSRVYQQERRGARLLELLHELETMGHISETVDVSITGVVDQTSEAPAVEQVHGRQDELQNVLQSVGRSPLIVATGMAGIGKTTLGVKVCDELRGERSLFWRRLRPWDSSASLAQRLAVFLEPLGRTALSSYLKATKDIDLAQVEEILLHQMVGLDVLLVFDDVHVAPTDAGSFLSLLFDVLRQVSGSSALLLSRTTPGFYSRRAVTMEEEVVETPLRALDSASGKAILADAGVPEVQQAELYGLSGGSPLFLKLLARGGTSPESEHRWTTLDSYISEEIEPGLDEAERACLQVASLYEIAVPPAGILLGKRGDLGTLMGLRRKGLLEEMDGELLYLHDSVRDYFRRGLPEKRRKALAGSVVAWLEAEAQRVETTTREDSWREAIALLENALLLDTEPIRRSRNLEKLGDLYRGIEAQTDALRAFKEALELAVETEVQARLHRKMAGNFSGLLLVEEADQEVERGLALLSEAPSGERARLLKARAQIREHHHEDYRGAMEDVETALSWLPSLPEDRHLAAELEILKGVIHSLDPDHPDHLAAQWSFEAALEEYEALGAREFVGFCYRQIGFALLGQGKTEEAADFIEKGAKIAAETEEKWTLICKAWFLTEYVGNYAEAEQIYERSFEKLRKTDFPEKVWEYRLVSDLYRRQGRYEEARETLEYFLEVSKGIINVYRRVESLAVMARLCLLTEDVEGAERYLAEAESERGGTVSGWLDLDLGWARGMVMAAKGKVSEAETAFRRVMGEPAVPDGRRGIVMDYLATFVDRGEALLDYGLVLSYWGKKGRAKEVLTQARDELEAHGRKLLEEKALAALRSLEADP